MKKILSTILIVTAAGASSAAFAKNPNDGTQLPGCIPSGGVPPKCGSATAVPEIDGASTGIAFALVGGMVLLVRERRRMTKEASAV